MDFMASILRCDEGGSIVRFQFGRSLNSTRVLLPFIQQSPYIIKENKVIGFDSDLLKWEPLPDNSGLFSIPVQGEPV